MTLEEAKRRDDYKFTNNIGDYIKEIRQNWMSSLSENGDPLRGIAVMEIGYFDIELNIYTNAQIGIDDGNIPVFEYFVCVKDKEYRWHSYMDLLRKPKVDWKKNNWKTLLENDMFEKLDRWIKNNIFDYNKSCL